MHFWRLRKVRKGLLLGLAVTPFALTACLAYDTPGSGVSAPNAPAGGSSESRLPGLLQQFQGNTGAGLELIDSVSSEVLAAQDGDGAAEGATNPAVQTAATPTPTPPPPRQQAGRLRSSHRDGRPEPTHAYPCGAHAPTGSPHR